MLPCWHPHILFGTHGLIAYTPSFCALQVAASEAAKARAAAKKAREDAALLASAQRQVAAAQAAAAAKASGEGFRMLVYVRGL